MLLREPWRHCKEVAQMCHLRKAVLTLDGFRSSFTNGTLHRGEQGTAAQGARDRVSIGGSVFGGLCCQSWQSKAHPCSSSLPGALPSSQAPIALLSDSYIA